jgi:hypothetical protein
LSIDYVTNGPNVLRKNKNGIMKIGSYSRKLVGICIKSIKSSSQTSLFDWRALTKKTEEKGWYSGLLLQSKQIVSLTVGPNFPL